MNHIKTSTVFNKEIINSSTFASIEDQIKEFETKINKEAEEGWEPINLTSEGLYQSHPRMHYLLRRLKR